ncbi:T9SS type A sorting domain-containing protein [candidate division KSB1 bacterium]|nr:T9SS type A sorting domain-containing protein [candidate division KSB1 bacterium]
MSTKTQLSNATFLFFVIALIFSLVANAQTYFSDNFEEGMSKWISSDWDITSVTSRTGDYSIESEEGYFEPNANSTLLLKNPINLLTSSEPVLSFWHKISVPDGSWDDDFGYVEVSIDGGTKWEILLSFNDVVYSTWSFERADLSAYKSSSLFLIRFILRADGDNDLGDGWILDDVTIKEKDQQTLPFPFYDGFEDGHNNWEIGPEWGIISNDARSGTRCITETPESSYIANCNSTILTALPFDISTSTEPILRFWYKIAVSDGSWDDDYGYVEVSSDGGTTWNTLITFRDFTHSTWSFAQADLGDFKSTEALIRFRLRADGDGDTGFGFSLDDIEIKEKDQQTLPFDFYDGFESNLNNWMAGPEWKRSDIDPQAGNFCLEELPDSTFIPNCNSTIISRFPIDLTSSVCPRIRYWYKVDVSDGSWDDDYCYVEASEDGGTTWLELLQYTNITKDSWSFEQVDLVKFVGKKIYIRFRLRADGDKDLGQGLSLDEVEFWDPCRGSNQSPIIESFNADPIEGIKPLLVTFSLKAQDLDGKIQKVEFDFDNDSLIDSVQITDESDISTTIKFTYREPGKYRANCRVMDDSSLYSAPATVEINVLPDSSQIYIPDTEVKIGDTVSIAIKYRDFPNIAGGKIQLLFDQNVVDAVEVDTLKTDKGFIVKQVDGDGTFTFNMARAEGLSETSGDLAYIRFTPSANAQDHDTTTIKFQHVELYDSNAEPIEVLSRQGGLVTIIDTVCVVEKIIVDPDIVFLDKGDHKMFEAFGICDHDTIPVNATWFLEKNFGNIGNLAETTATSVTLTGSGAGDALLIASYTESTTTLTDTAIVVVGETKGDINLDGKVNVQDAILCLQLIKPRMFTPTPYQEWAADFDDDGDIYEVDALLILDKDLETILPKASEFGPAIVRIGSYIREDGKITLPIAIDGRTDVHAFGLEMKYDVTKLTLLECKPVRQSSLIQCNNNSNTIRVSMINTKKMINSSGHILNLTFSVDGDFYPQNDVNIKTVRLYDRCALEIEVTEICSDIYTTVPEIFSLHQNYPNPFNPTTTIQFDLPEPGKVKLSVYNISGQLVATLVDANMQAGEHSVSWDAIDQPTGIYFYRIVVADTDYHNTKRMVLMK